LKSPGDPHHSARRSPRPATPIGNHPPEGVAHHLHHPDATFAPPGGQAPARDHPLLEGVNSATKGAEPPSSANLASERFAQWKTIHPPGRIPACRTIGVPRTEALFPKFRARRIRVQSNLHAIVYQECTTDRTFVR